MTMMSFFSVYTHAFEKNKMYWIASCYIKRAGHLDSEKSCTENLG